MTCSFLWEEICMERSTFLNTTRPMLILLERMHDQIKPKCAGPAARILAKCFTSAVQHPSIPPQYTFEFIHMTCLEMASQAGGTHQPRCCGSAGPPMVQALWLHRRTASHHCLCCCRYRSHHHHCSLRACNRHHVCICLQKSNALVEQFSAE